MGTELYRHHIFTNRCYDELNLSDPGLIKSVHQDYCDAGADVLTTNTYGANRISLEKHGLADQVAKINTAGVQITREVAVEAGRDVYIAGSVGPIISAVHSEIKLIEIILEQVSALAAAGVDVIIFGTQPSRAAGASLGFRHVVKIWRRRPESAAATRFGGGDQSRRWRPESAVGYRAKMPSGKIPESSAHRGFVFRRLKAPSRVVP